MLRKFILLIYVLFMASALHAKSPINAYQYDTDSASYTLAKFINFMADKNYKEMVSFSQERWRQKESDPVGTMKNLFGDYNIVSAKIIKEEKKTSTYSTVEAEIVYTLSYMDGERTGHIQANVIKEGTWFGVNPYSAMIK